MNDPSAPVMVLGMPWRRWPALPIPSEEMLRGIAREHGPDAVHAFWEQREAAIRNEIADPLNCGWESPAAKIAHALLDGTYVPGMVGTAVAPAGWNQQAKANDLLFGGGNGSGKSHVCAAITMKKLMAKREREARCFSSNEETSRGNVQKPLFRFLPKDLQKIKRQGQVTKISYSFATGFSENKFVLPNASQALFPTYKSWQQDRNSVEGGTAHVVWDDEEVPAELLDTQRARALKGEGGIVLVSFTPVSGYIEAIGQYLDGATVLETIPAARVSWDPVTGQPEFGEPLLTKFHRPKQQYYPGCPPGHVPLVMQCSEPSGRRFVILCPTMFNPYMEGGDQGIDALINYFTSKNFEFALERLWGLPTKRNAPAFPRFGDVHIVSPDRIPPLREMTCYQFTDPHGARNWFTQWWGRDVDGNRWLYREWPDISSGQWAVSGGDGKPGGKEGEAQRYDGGKGFAAYKKLFLKLEGWAELNDGTMSQTARSDVIVERLMDPRPAGTKVASEEDGETYLEWMAKPVCDAKGNILVPGLDFSAAPACGVDEGMQLIGNVLTEGWDPDKALDPINCPKTYISRDCQNTIFALKTCPLRLKEDDAVKDPVDTTKGMAKHGIPYIEPGRLMSRGGGSY